MRLIVLASVLLFITVDLYSQEVSLVSKVSCSVEAYHDETIIGTATGFFFATSRKVYFMTNNHVVGGKFAKQDYFTQHGHEIPVDSLPTKLIVRAYGPKANETINIHFPLEGSVIFFHTDNSNRELMDVVALPVSANVLPGLAHTMVLSSRDILPDLLLAPSSELFIVGFPYDLARYNTYPIWKRGTIASDPNLRDLNGSKFWIDATTRAGMSGSPVLFRGQTYATRDAPLNMSSETNTFLVGIYSAQSYNMELGIVWDLYRVIQSLNELD